MGKINYPIANPMITFREELDDWAILFDPDANETFALDPISAFIWQRLDGNHSREDILAELNSACEAGIPDNAPQHLDDFLAELSSKSLIGIEA